MYWGRVHGGGDGESASRGDERGEDDMQPGWSGRGIADSGDERGDFDVQLVNDEQSECEWREYCCCGHRNDHRHVDQRDGESAGGGIHGDTDEHEWMYWGRVHGGGDDPTVARGECGC